MKIQLFLLLVFFGTGKKVLAQTESVASNNDDIMISVGYGVHSNSLNRNHDLEFKDPNYEHLNNLQTWTLKIAVPTKKNNISLFFGALIEKDLSDNSSFGYTPGRTNSHNHNLIGGGVFGGIRPVWGKENFGVTSEFGLGAFSYKETYSHFNNISEPHIDINKEKNTFGLGGYSSIGFYLKIGMLGINPNINAVVTGGESGSFLFYGVSVPLTVHF